MANWFGKKRSNRRVLGGTSSEHELDYGELFTAYVRGKQKDMSRQRQQAEKMAHQIKKDQQHNS